MTRHAFNVVDTVYLRGRGVIVETNKRYEDLPSWLALKIGDEIEFRFQGKSLQTRVAGIERIGMWTSKTPFAFLLPADIAISQVPRGCEIWVMESSVRKPVEKS